LPDIVGKGYRDFWNFRGRYKFVKGGRGSKKSCTAALRVIYNMMKYPEANTLVIRRFFYTHRDSTFAQLKWAAKRFGVEHLWTFKGGKLECVYKPTGTKILFRGMDDPLSITSITVDVGMLCFVWVEEAYQIMDEAAFDRIDLSIRGVVPPGYFKQFMFTFNPWSDKHWLKRRFFDVSNDDILATTTTHRTNEWLDDADRKVFASMSANRRLVEEDGEWGIAEGAIYSEFIENERDLYTEWNEEYKCFYVEGKPQRIDYIHVGVDWGGNKSGHALVATAITRGFDYAIILAGKRYEAVGTTPEDICNWTLEFCDKITQRYGSIDSIYADSAEQLLINLLRQKTDIGVRNSIKKPIIDRIRFTVEMFAQRRLLLTEDCENVVNFFKSAIYDPKALVDKRLDDGSYDQDSGDAFEYSIERYIRYLIRE